MIVEDVNGTPAMLAICEAAKVAFTGLVPVLNITTNDNICSSVQVMGSFDAKETWANGIFHNSRYFLFFIRPKGRYYAEGEKVSVEFMSGKHGLPKFRKYTGTPERCIEKLREWLNGNQA